MGSVAELVAQVGQGHLVLGLIKQFERTKGFTVTDSSEEALIGFWIDFFESSASTESSGEKSTVNQIPRSTLCEQVYAFFDWRRSACPDLPWWPPVPDTIASPRKPPPRRHISLQAVHCSQEQHLIQNLVVEFLSTKKRPHIDDNDLACVLDFFRTEFTAKTELSIDQVKPLLSHFLNGKWLKIEQACGGGRNVALIFETYKLAPKHEKISNCMFGLSDRIVLSHIKQRLHRCFVKRSQGRNAVTPQKLPESKPNRLMTSPDLLVSAKRGKLNLATTLVNMNEIDRALGVIEEHFSGKLALPQGLVMDVKRCREDIESRIVERTRMATKRMPRKKAQQRPQSAPATRLTKPVSKSEPVNRSPSRPLAKKEAPKAKTPRPSTKAKDTQKSETAATQRRMCYNWLEFGHCNNKSCSKAHSMEEWNRIANDEGT